MTFRLAASLAISAAALLAPLPALAQSPDFGDDSGVWANDGECDDPRFQGAGVSTSASDADLMRDASDCRAAVAAGTATLIGGQAAQPAQPGAKPGQAGAAVPAADPAQPAQPAQPVQPADPAQPAQPAQPAAATVAINFGDDSSRYANDGECDDRRFTGPGMATLLSWENLGRDATDCRSLLGAGQVTQWDAAAAAAATRCAAVDFGDDTGQYANDGQCDDIRFEGPLAAWGLSADHTGRDASDCSRLCAFGAVSLRDY